MQKNSRQQKKEFLTSQAKQQPLEFAGLESSNTKAIHRTGTSHVPGLSKA